MYLYSWPGGSPEATFAIVAVITALYLGVIWLATIVWTLRDISQRTESMPVRMGATMLVTATFVAGLPVYLILRPRYTVRQLFELKLEEEALLQEVKAGTACPECSRPIKDDFIVCPACRAQLKTQCRKCAKPLAHAWIACPYCADKAPAMKPVEASRLAPAMKPAHTATSAEASKPVPAATPAAVTGAAAAEAAPKPTHVFETPGAPPPKPASADVAAASAVPATAVVAADSESEEEPVYIEAAAS